MALTFGALTSDRVNCGSAAAIDDFAAFTMLTWCYPTALNDNRTLISKTGGPGTGKYLTAKLTAGNLALTVDRATADGVYVTNDTPLSTLNKWYLVAATYDEAATPSIRIYVGDLAAIAVERTYGTATNGSGATGTDAANSLLIGNFSTNNLAWQGRIAVASYINRALTLQEIISWQFRPRVISGCLGLWQLGWNGVSTQPDYSGNANNGTVTGATVGDHVPLGPFFGMVSEVPYVVAGLSGGVEGSASGISTVSGTLSAPAYLFVVDAGTSTVNGSIYARGLLKGSSIGSSSVVGDLSASGSLVVSVAGSSATLAVLIAIGSLQAIVIGQSITLGSLIAVGKLEGTVGGTSTVSGDVKSVQQVDGISSGVATTVGTLKAVGYLVGDISGSATVTGDIQAEENISGSVTGISSVTGTLSAAGYLSGSADGNSSVSGMMVLPSGYVAGAVSGTSTVDGTLSAIGFLTGQTVGQGNDVVTLTAVGYLAGSISALATVSGTLQQPLNFIEGSVSGSSTSTGMLWAIGYIQGISNGTSTASLVPPGVAEIEDSVPMLSAGIWRKNQPNTILFVLSDSSGVEVAGLGSTFVVQLSKTGNPFAASGGTKSEIGLGWYKYVSTISEADTSGPIALVVTGAGVVQQNLEYTVEDRVVNAIEFTYTLTNTATSLPIPGADVSFSIDNNPANTVWTGITDAFGVARDLNGNLPRLVSGSYFVFSYRPGFVFNVDQEIVS